MVLKMNSNERREKILCLLKDQEHPITATALAKQFDISRQVIVGDIALIRASGSPVFATHWGYVYQKTLEEHFLTHTIVSQHSGDQMADELYTILDYGCAILDVTVEHPIYGQIVGQLQIFSRIDADDFLDKIRKTSAEPLSQLTGGIHLHTIQCRNEESYQKLLEALTQKGILYEK